MTDLFANVCFGDGLATVWEMLNAKAYVGVALSWDAVLARGVMEEHACCTTHCAPSRQISWVTISFNQSLTFRNPSLFNR